MEERSSSSCVRKRGKRDHTCDFVDRISTLPDPLIHHIYSFLETRLMIQASTLSTRWRHLWVSSPYLNFELKRSGELSLRLSKSDKKERDSFVRFVYRILVVGNASSILKFSLDSRSVINGGHISTWIVAALNRNVKELQLLLTTKDQHFEVPSSLFTSGITVLTLKDNLSDDNIRVSNAMCSAARIKSLRLEYVRLPDGNSDGELVLSCPVLEDLTLYTCEDSHLKVFTVSAPLLKTLNLTSENCMEKFSHKMNICSPKLTSFTCSWFFADFYLVNLPDLVSADIDIFRYVNGSVIEKELCDKCLITIVKGICSVQDLKLSSRNMKDILGSPIISEMLPNLFHNLRDFTLEEGGHVDAIASISEITNVLKSLPSIQVFVWDRYKSKRVIIPKKGKHQGEELPAQCIFDFLRIVKIENSHGMENELKFLEFILERAIYLKEISIVPAWNEDQLEEFCQKLVALPRASSNVVIYCP